MCERETAVSGAAWKDASCFQPIETGIWPGSHTLWTGTERVGSTQYMCTYREIIAIIARGHLVHPIQAQLAIQLQITPVS